MTSNQLNDNFKRIDAADLKKIDAAVAIITSEHADDDARNSAERYISYVFDYERVENNEIEKEAENTLLLQECERLNGVIGKLQNTIVQMEVRDQSQCDLIEQLKSEIAELKELAVTLTKS